MVFQRIQVSFKCYDSIQIPYMEKMFGACIAELMYVMLARLEKKKPWGMNPI